jgi:hypothetical protein
MLVRDNQSTLCPTSLALYFALPPMVQRGSFSELARDYPDVYSWATTFHPPAPCDPEFNASHWAKDTIEGLHRDFAAGAVAVKV